MPPRITVLQSTVRKVCQLTGETDRERRRPTFNRTETQFGLFGTDLGSSFEHGGRLWFLFGDTWPGPAPTNNADSVAWTTDADPEAGDDPGIHLTFVARGGHYVSPRLTDSGGREMGVGAFNVPIAGFSDADGQMFIVYSTDSFTECAGDGGLDAFWIGRDGAVGTTWANPGTDAGRWRPPFHITPPGAARPRPGSPLAVVSRFGNALDVFWIGPDGAVATAWMNPDMDGGAWHPPFPVTPSGAARADSGLAAVTRLDGALDVFWIGPDGAVATTWTNPKVDQARWHPPFPITPSGAARVDSGLAAVTRLEGALDAFWIGPDGAVATTWANPKLDQARWHPPFPITPPGAARADSGLTAVTRLEGALDAFWIGPDGAVATTWANPKVEDGRWQEPFSISPPGATAADSPPAALTRLEGALDAFWVGADGIAATTWANPKIDGARWHPPFPITPPGAARAGTPLAVATRRSGGGAVLMGRSVLAAATNNDPTNLTALCDISRIRDDGKFLNLACEISGGINGLPFTGSVLLAWGSGRYRDSNVFLGAVPLAQVRDPTAWRFLIGVDQAANRPFWGTDQRAAAPLFLQQQVGELSVGWIEPLGLWLMLYNAGRPRGINARVAAEPWGTWSDPTLIFDPGWPGVGYGHFMHVKDASDGLNDPGREGAWGGEYGPYLMRRYTKATGGGGTRQARVYFVMSTWNPYNTVLMAATLQRDAERSPSG